jgi:hypothetical protein
MFFGWAGMFPLYVIFQRIKEFSIVNGSALNWMRSALVSILVLSPITYLFFLLWGYHPVAIGDADIPLAAVFSSFVMVAWYVFMVGYRKVNPKEVSESSKWFGMALLMLGVSSLGAWGVGVLQASGIDNILLSKAMTHFFLGTFTEGWVVLVIGGILIEKLELTSEELLISSEKLRMMIAFGAPLTFSYGITESLLTPELLWSARAGGLLSSAAIIALVFAAAGKCRNAEAIWFWPVILLGMKGMMQLVVSIYPSGVWFSDHSLRILYLHMLLLGAFTLTGFAFLHTKFKTKPHSYYLMVLSCVILLLSLVLPTGLIPSSVKGAWIFYTMVFAAGLPVIAAIYYWIQTRLT